MGIMHTIQHKEPQTVKEKKGLKGLKNKKYCALKK
jgi:hypothetical protein